MAEYSQLKAYLSIVKASFRSITKSPSSVIFSLAFPLIFIVSFGFLGGGGPADIKIAVAANTDTNTTLFKSIAADPSIHITPSTEDPTYLLKNGKVVAVISGNEAGYTIQSSAAYQAESDLLKVIVQHYAQPATTSSNINFSSIPTKNFKSIDFILPGQLGFSILATAIFGTAFVFFGLRQLLVMKRFFATPIRKEFILLGEASARVIFHILGAIFIITIGYFVFDFTLIHGWLTFVQMIVLCIIGLLMFMSYGFIISGIAKSESVIPPIANMLVLPQFLLADTLIPLENMPTWLQYLGKIMPLTHLNQALRAVAFEGANLWDVKIQIAILLGWGILGYFIATKTFKWE